ncbi:M23 family metallopeptidase [Candidatus Soleaferrea massiliensis]|uniref:M23 family metallopeptidase n=1 Tax=Candidatus Soleaferrea massiliensis TaxID=1470354 RepID=UPI00058FB9F6|nr:M23 family metallopeptidase [Candidatus Soleaferrea massiliensis]
MQSDIGEKAGSLLTGASNVINQTFEYAYRVSYLAGSRLIRYGRRISKAVSSGMKTFFRPLKKESKLVAAKTTEWAHIIADDIAGPFKKIRNGYIIAKRRVKHASRKGATSVMKECFYLLKRDIKECKHVIVKFFNYVMPVLAVVVLVLTLQHFGSLNYALSVEYEGEQLGYIADEAVFERAQKMMQGRVVYEQEETPKEMSARFTLTVVDADTQFASVDHVTDKLIEISGNNVSEADGLYVDDKFIGAAENGEKLIELLNSMLDQYRTGTADERVEFVKPIQVKQGLYPVSSIVDVENIESSITREVQGEQVYTIKKGDVPITVASEHDLSVADLKELNPNIDEAFFPGQELLISRSQPFLGVRTIRTESKKTAIKHATKKINDATLEKGTEKVKTEGVDGEKNTTYEVTYIDGVEESRTTIKEETLKKAVDEVVLVGTKEPEVSYGSSGSSGGYVPPSIGAGSTQFIWPAQGYISCGLYGYAGHTGIDITTSGAYGKPIYASAAGTVTYAGQSGPYGMHVIIDHGNGVTTLYAHASALYVSTGAKVSQGQTIAAIGQTGNAFGAHCHFEIRINGQYMNPVNYLP